MRCGRGPPRVPLRDGQRGGGLQGRVSPTQKPAFGDTRRNVLGRAFPVCDRSPLPYAPLRALASGWLDDVLHARSVRRNESSLS
jgi:hypothetical protein